MLREGLRDQMAPPWHSPLTARPLYHPCNPCPCPCPFLIHHTPTARRMHNAVDLFYPPFLHLPEQRPFEPFFWGVKLVKPRPAQAQ
ncbi:hypothetical protein Mmc1_3201 [Magnetococcus marinus MC-1]|uniref:Uncharacterized protein n=1 Tax=Magnetococcus marinus (strain ATCC BAA-1437 / JCM 17883 / MC-1) TaxID=156889 RepID=A0LCJ8_MAGMM|nr:hypothetical protein Mmc1_3201 [Magnetococcus marinus MC-1]